MKHLLIVFAGILTAMNGSATLVRAQTAHVVEGTEDDNQKNVWKYKQDVSPAAAALGDPAKRLRIEVANGDTVAFRVTGNRKHGVIFERAKDEQGNKVWSVTGGPQKLADIDDTFKDFDKNNAQKTDPVDSGDIITITVTGLKPGDTNGILFACNPHSKKGSDPNHPKNREMLGVIVLKGN